MEKLSRLFSKIFGIVLFLSVIMCCPAFAQVMLEQGRVALKLQPGEKISDSITAINRGQVPLTLRVYLEDFEYEPPYRGSKKFSPPGTTTRSCAPWMTFSPAILNLEPQEKGKINYSIAVPEDAKGGYNAVLFIENNPQQSDAKIGVKIVTRVGSLFFLETPDSLRNAKVGNVALEKNKLSGQITNQGNVISVLKSTYYILDKGGITADRGEIETICLSPAKTADFSINLPEDLKADTYTVVLTFDLGEGVSVVTEVDFIKSKEGSIQISGIRS
jgi:hypothetical protein